MFIAESTYRGTLVKLARKLTENDLSFEVFLPDEMTADMVENPVLRDAYLEKAKLRVAVRFKDSVQQSLIEALKEAGDTAEAEQAKTILGALLINADLDTHPLNAFVTEKVARRGRDLEQQIAAYNQARELVAERFVEQEAAIKRELTEAANSVISRELEDHFNRDTVRSIMSGVTQPDMLKPELLLSGDALREYENLMTQCRQGGEGSSKLRGACSKMLRTAAIARLKSEGGVMVNELVDQIANTPAPRGRCRA